MPRAALAAACAAAGIVMPVLLQGCGSSQANTGAGAHYEEVSRRSRGSATLRTSGGTSNFIESPGPYEAGLKCPGLVVDGAHGKVRILESQAGQSPTIVCPGDYAYKGPRIECGWVDQLCEVQGRDETVSKDLCTLEYNFTYEGKSLARWPDGAVPRLVSTTRSPGSAVEINEGGRDTGTLPPKISSEAIACERETFVDFDFQHAKIRKTYPPYTADAPWSKSFEGVAAVGNKPVDLLVTREKSLEPPGNVWLDGNSSAVGRINVDQGEPALLRFQLMEHGTDKPAALSKFYLTLFDLRSGRDRSKRLRASGMAEYYVSSSTLLQANRTSGGDFVFTGVEDLGSDDRRLGDRDEKDPPSDLELAWLSSLDRSVVLMFRNTASFVLEVQALGNPKDQILEFAGWSELVDMGVRVPTQAHGTGDGNEMVIRDSLSDQPLAK